MPSIVKVVYTSVFTVKAFDDGHWADGKPRGHGVYRFANGDKFESLEDAERLQIELQLEAEPEPPLEPEPKPEPEPEPEPMLELEPRPEPEPEPEPEHVEATRASPLAPTAAPPPGPSGSEPGSAQTSPEDHVRAFLQSLSLDRPDPTEGVVAAFTEAHYHPSTWVQELQGLVEDGLLEGFLGSIATEDAGSARTQEAERRGKKKRRKKKKKKGGKEKKRDDEDKQEPELAGADLPEGVPEGVPPAAPDTGRQRSESEAAQAEEDAVRLRLPPHAGERVGSACALRI